MNRAEGKESKVVILDGHAFLRLDLSRLEKFADDWDLQWEDAEQDPLKTVGLGICRQRWRNPTSNQGGLAWEVCVGPVL